MSPPTKRLPAWAWCLTLIGFPSSVFVAYGFARILTWRRSIAFALLSAGCSTAYVTIMIQMEGVVPETDVGRMIIEDAMCLSTMGWCLLLYYLGKDVSYWTPALLRGWRRAKWLGIAMICLMLLPPFLFLAIYLLKR